MGKLSLALGITGGIACGKTTFGALLRSYGVSVCEADELAAGQLKPGTPVFEKVVAAFGREILLVNGLVNRSYLAHVIFSDAKKREMLNAIVHPPVREMWRSWLSAEREAGRHAAVIIPLLYEIEETSLWDAVICVAASEKNSSERLIKRGVQPERVGQWLAAQLPLEEKMRRADYVVRNDGSLLELADMAKRLIATIWQKKI